MRYEAKLSLLFLFLSLETAGALTLRNYVDRTPFSWRGLPRRRSSTKVTGSRNISRDMSVTGSTTNIAKRPKPKPVYLVHERDYFRQMSRLESMDSYVLVSTLTSSISFGALLGFSALHHTMKMSNPAILWFYQGICVAIPIVSGLSSLCGLYATLVFSLTILYGKSALGAERDREYDRLIRKTVRARVHGSRSFLLSLWLFAIEAYLLLLERTFAIAWCVIPVAGIAAFLLYNLYRDWRLLYETAEIIFKD